MPLRGKLILFVTGLLIIITLVLTSVWYRDSNSIMNSYAEETASSLMKDAYNAFSYLLTDADYLSSLVIMNRENIITPLQIINDEAKGGYNQLTYNQLVNKRLIDSYIGSMYGHKYYITGISVVSASGYLFKTGEVLYYPYDLVGKLHEYGVSEFERRMVLLPPVSDDYSSRQNHFVVPALRNILNMEGIPVGFVIIYFDYAIIRDIFSNNLPPNSIFEVHDKLGNVIFSNRDENTAVLDQSGQYYVESHFFAEKAEWNFDMAIPTAEIRRKINSTIRRTLIIMLVIALAAIILSVFMIGEFKKLLERISAEEKLKRKTEIDFLQAQINPHFISNTLNTISWMAKMSNATNIAFLAKSLTALMQSSMKRGSEFIPVADEIAYTKNYVEIQKYSAFYDFEISFTIPDGLESFYTPRFVLQPLVENAIIHGFSEKNDSHRIEVSVSRTGDSLRLEVFDNGKGMKQTQVEELMNAKRKTKDAYNRIGIKNIQERIKLFFGEHYGLSFESEENTYTRAILLIPVLTASDREHTGE